MTIMIRPATVYSAESSSPTASTHSHSNLGILNKLSIDSQGNLSFSGKIIAESSVETSYSTTLTAQNINSHSLELPNDCDTSKAIIFTLQGLSFVQGKDWRLIEHTAPDLDVISWENLALQAIVQQGDSVSITYYKKS